MNGIARMVALALGLAALALSFARLADAPEAFFRSYLPACLFWLGIPLGSLAWLMIHRLTLGRWGGFAGPVLRAGAAVLPVNALLFLPLGFGLPALFPWARAGWQAQGVGQALWLQAGFFGLREGIVFLLWLGAAALFCRPLPVKGAGAASALGLIVYGLTVTVFAIDWIMSLEPRWASANIGFLAASGSLLQGLAFATGALCLVARRRPPPADRFADLGGLLLALVLLWSYLAFEEYLTVWSENLPGKVLWYVQRNADGWRGWIWLTAVLYGALPFLLLLSRGVKRDPRRLRLAAGLILVGGALYAYWQVLPGFYPAPSALSPLDALPLVGIGGLWLAAFGWLLPRYLTPHGREACADD
ncbi:hypothetical protein [Candidatus Methylocalor cossyra]|uniref:Quinol:cytochrome c oxidoreductase quinone-binding subunit 2 n=1 Tax=Candidatus Methylocalor cossyra TaxID=3108543 RepID=A0ABP1C5C9_9GAMM